MPLEGQMPASDVAPADEVRSIIRIPGRYSLADKRNARGERRVFMCRAIYLSPREIAIAGPVVGNVGDRVIAIIEQLGKIEGPIIRLLRSGFMMKIAGDSVKRDQLAAKIEWLENFKNHDAPDKRDSERIIPANPHSRLIYADGSIENCVILNFSVSGAAVSAETPPDIRTVLAVGSMVGRVIRHFDGGFAVRFIEQQQRDAVEATLFGER
jgi:hypothetical protein